jgi:hypothetical protein
MRLDLDEALWLAGCYGLLVGLITLGWHVWLWLAGLGR